MVFELDKDWTHTNIIFILLVDLILLILGELDVIKHQTGKDKFIINNTGINSPLRKKSPADHVIIERKMEEKYFGCVICNIVTTVTRI